MHLWTEYEGRTIAGAYTLGKLLRSEGRNGFFTTSDDTGHSAVIRLTEAHFDEDEQLKRWTQVADVHQDNLIEIEQVGKTTFDGVPLTYALMEPDDANLGDVLKERPLTAAEAMQVAKSVVAALAALHSNGMVHEHVEPSNVLAVGEVVKLRSDCVRECVADVEFNTPEGCAGLRKRDVHDFGILLLQCLTLDKEWTPATKLAEPFNRIIPRAIDGSWTLEQIGSFLDPVGFAPKTAAALSAGGQTPVRAVNPAVVQPVRGEGSALSQPRSSVVPQFNSEPSIPVRAQESAEAAEHTGPSMNAIWAVCIAAAVLVALLAWHFLGSKPANPGPVAAVSSAPASTTAATPAPVVRPAAPVARASVASLAPEARSAAPAVAHAAGWYVIAYTYNHQGQAQNKADHIGRSHSGLQPQVFSPSGHGPYLVSLGGAMSESEARALWQRARRSGMPRDTFVRRY